VSGIAPQLTATKAAGEGLAAREPSHDASRPLTNVAERHVADLAGGFSNAHDWPS